jgi:GT2 family glycosyltransferase
VARADSRWRTGHYSYAVPVTLIIPNWNGRRWLPACLAAIADQTLAPAEVIVVDNGSDDGSREYLNAEHPEVRVIQLGRNTGFAHAANRGIVAATCPFVALLNTDVVLGRNWVERSVHALSAGERTAAVATKMLQLDDPEEVYDAGDILRRDGACEQRGRFGRDDGRYDQAGEIFGACAGAALYRRDAVLAVGGFDERFFAYLEDVDLALALRLAGWRCRYEPTVALHAGESSSRNLVGGHMFLVQRNTLLLVAKWFPIRWLPLVLYRQAAWAWHAAREGGLRTHLRATAAAIPLVLDVVRQRQRSSRRGIVPIAEVVEGRPIRGRAAGGHPAGTAASRSGQSGEASRHLSGPTARTRVRAPSDRPAGMSRRR